MPTLKNSNSIVEFLCGRIPATFLLWSPSFVKKQGHNKRKRKHLCRYRIISFNRSRFPLQFERI